MGDGDSGLVIWPIIFLAIGIFVLDLTALLFGLVGLLRAEHKSERLLAVLGILLSVIPWLYLAS